MTGGDWRDLGDFFMDRLHSENLPALPVADQPEPPAPAPRAPWAKLRSDTAQTRPVTDDRSAAHTKPVLAAGDDAADRSPGVPSDQAQDSLVDVSLLVDYGRFVTRSVRRHIIGALATLVLTMSAVALVANVWPRTYQVDGRLLVRRSGLVSALVNPDRSSVRDGDTPGVAAQEVVRSRENLLDIMKATNLMAEWERTRTPLLRFKDRIVALARGPQTAEQRLDGVLGLLEDRLQVGATEQGAIGFVLTWRDPEMARQLVEKAMQNFLEHQRVTEASAIADSIAILDRSADALEAQVNSTMAQLPRGRAPVSRAAPPERVATAPTAPTGPSPEATVRLARLRSALEERQQEVNRLDATRTQQLAEAQAQLSAALTLYTDGHPTVAPLRQRVARLSGESAELAAARREARNLATEYDALSTSVSAATANAEQERLMSQVQTPTPMPSVEFIRGNNDADPVGLRLKNQLAELAAVSARASAARAELAAATVGFKYQYSVVKPPRLPRGPLRPNVPAILAAGAIASLLLALAFAVSADLASGRVLEAWQVERLVRAPISLRIPSL